MKRAIIVFLALPAPAFAEPLVGCKPEGPALFAIDHRALNAQPTSITTLFESGGWTVVAKDAAGKVASAKKGCLEKLLLDKIEADVKVPWTVTQKRINCKLVATTWTVDSLRGKDVFTERACGKDLLDDKSAAALADIHGILDKL